MSSKTNHRRLAARVAREALRAGVALVERRQSGAPGVHQDQNRRRGGKAARGGRQGERQAYQKEAWV